MFEDSLVESTGRIRTRSRRYAAGSFLLQAALLVVVIAMPYLYPDALPRKFLSVPLIAPPPAPAPHILEQSPAASNAHSEMVDLALTAPPRIPHGIHTIVDTGPASVPGDLASGIGNGPPGALFPISPATPPPAVHLAKPSGPVRISSGVAAGQLIAPIRPTYPQIGIETRTQGTVVVAATIAADGTIENLRVLSGPPLLVNAAVQAIRQARYRPYLLNGSPVEVETTISVVFKLEGN